MPILVQCTLITLSENKVSFNNQYFKGSGVIQKIVVKYSWEGWSIELNEITRQVEVGS